VFLSSKLTHLTSVTVVSGLRLKSLVNFAASNNPTWDQTEVIKWSNIEINVGIICACMPALRVIFVHMFPKMLGSRNGPSTSYYKYGSHKRGTHGDASVVRSALSRKNTSSTEPISITYTKSFAVQHGESDEISLVQLDGFGAKTFKVKSGSTSEVSV
jgi:hypothetical protein